MEVNIRELLEGLEDSSVPMEDTNVVSATRIKELTKMKIESRNQKSYSGTRRRIITFALAAALVLSFGVVAYATGFFGLIDSQMSDTVVEYAGVNPVSSLSEVSESGEKLVQGLNQVPVRVVSLQGWRGSPEYLANQEWQSFYDDYRLNEYYGDEVPNPALKTDSWYEAHSQIYTAYTPALKNKVLEICEKYSLKPLDFYTEGIGMEDFYSYIGNSEVLNIDAFDGQEFQLDGVLYRGYDAGTFQLQFSYSVDDNYDDNIFVDLMLNRAAKGYFRTGYALFAENDELSEWEYTNCYGDTLCLILGENNAVILYDSENAFVTLQADFTFMHNNSGETASQKMLERLADLVNFGSLGQER